MKVEIVNNIKDIADIPEDNNAPIITRDGAKLVTVSIVGQSPVHAIIGTMRALLTVLDGDVSSTTVYLAPGTLSSSVGENRFTVVVGVTGMLDLDERLQKVDPSLKSEEPAPADPAEPTDAVIVEKK